MAQYTPNFNLYEPDSSDDFADFRTEFNNNMNIIDQNLGGGGGSGGHTIYDKDGNALAQESGLQFTGSVNVTDDNVNGRTVVDVSGGSNLILDAQIYSTEEKQVGVWTDKKPLYEITVPLGALPNNAIKTVPHGIANVDMIFVSDSFFQTGAGASSYLNFTNDSTAGQIEILVDKTNIEIWAGSNRSSWNGYATVRYTKTTDVAGSGGYEAYGFSPVIYSDVERKIGVWRDNKPLYQRAFTGLSVVLGSDWVNAIDISTMDMENCILGIGIVSNTYQTPLCTRINGNYLQAYMNGMGGVTITTIVIQYTKTTDVAGSGDYNTYGVPTVHYSTNEQVIGTWINGKPLYEITVEVNSVVYNDWTDVFSLADADIKGYDSRTSYAQLNNGERVQLDWFVTTSIYNRSIITNSGTKFRVETQGNNYSKIVATIQYTKTTD